MKKLACATLLLACVALSCLGADEGLNPQDLTKTLSDSWPTFNGDYSGKRFSALSQINQSNVRGLTLAWVMRPKVGFDQVDAA